MSLEADPCNGNSLTIVIGSSVSLLLGISYPAPSWHPHRYVNWAMSACVHFIPNVDSDILLISREDWHLVFFSTLDFMTEFLKNLQYFHQCRDGRYMLKHQFLLKDTIFLLGTELNMNIHFLGRRCSLK